MDVSTLRTETLEALDKVLALPWPFSNRISAEQHRLLLAWRDTIQQSPDSWVQSAVDNYLREPANKFSVKEPKMALQDDVTKFIADLNLEITTHTWIGALTLVEDGAALVRDITTLFPPSPAPIPSGNLATLRDSLSAELTLPNINWQNVLAIVIAIVQALAPLILK